MLTAAALLFIGAGAFWWAYAADDDEPAPAGALASAPETLLAQAPPAAAPATVAAEAPIPEGMTANQWRMLNDSLKDAPNRQGEINRITDYMAFLSRAARFRALRASGASELPETHALARSLLDALPRHVALGETSVGEAHLMVLAFVDTLYANDVERDAQRDLQSQRVAAAAPASPSTAAATALDTRYQQAQAALVAQWYARPEAQRDESQLEASLDALRRKTYASSAAPATGGTKP